MTEWQTEEKWTADAALQFSFYSMVFGYNFTWIQFAEQMFKVRRDQWPT